MLNFSLVAGLIAGLILAITGPKHVYRITNGYSGEALWSQFGNEQPSESDFVGVILSDNYSLPGSGYKLGQLFRDCQAKGDVLFIKKEPDIALLAMPYAPEVSPSEVFNDSDGSGKFLMMDGRGADREDRHTRSDKKTVKIVRHASPAGQSAFQGIQQVHADWLTTPEMRKRVPYAALLVVYMFVPLIVVSAATFGLLKSFQLVWYFSLKRLSELSLAVRGRKHENISEEQKTL